MKSQLATLFLIIGLMGKLYAQKNRSDVFERTDAYLAQTMDSLGIIGLNYAILIDNEIVHKKSFGWANAQLMVPMTLERTFPVASISKLFSSVALYKLLDINKRNISETVGDFLPSRNDLPESWRKLTLKQLLSHTSGIPDQIDYQIYLAPESEKAVIDALRDKPFSAEPGTASKYNATGFLLIRAIIEELANQDFESHMQSEYFDTLNLGSAAYGGFKKVIPNRVTCYQNTNGHLEMFPLNYSPPMYAGAGLNIAIDDLTHWFQIIQKGKILTQEQLQELWTPVELSSGEDGGFGLGWESYRLPEGYRMVGHGGAGISSFRYYWNTRTNKNVTIILLTNGALNWTIRPNLINAQLANMILQEQ